MCSAGEERTPTKIAAGVRIKSVKYLTVILAACITPTRDMSARCSWSLDNAELEPFVEVFQYLKDEAEGWNRE